MEILKTIAVDIKHSVFENKTEAIMYITKDIYSDSFIIAIPVITFSWDIREESQEKDYEYLLNSNVIPLGDPVQKERLVTAIKEGIEKFE
jgi:uncharacterized membrane protein